MCNDLFITKLKSWLARPRWVGAILLVAAGNAMASSGGSGGSMPWDNALKTLQDNLTGPTALAVGTIAMFAAGGMLVLGREEMHGFVKTVLYIVLGVALLVNGSAIMTSLGIMGSGALVY